MSASRFKSIKKSELKIQVWKPYKVAQLNSETRATRPGSIKIFNCCFFHVGTVRNQFRECCRYLYGRGSMTTVFYSRDSLRITCRRWSVRF